MMRFRDCDLGFYCHWQGDKTERGQKVCGDCIHNIQAERQSLRVKLLQADKDIAGMAVTIKQRDTEITGLNQAFDAMRTKHTNRGVSIDGLKNQILTLTTKIKVSEFDSAHEIASLKRALDESGTIAKRYRGYWAEEVAEKGDLQDEVFNLEIKVLYAERIKDRWKAQAKKRDRRIKVLKDELTAVTFIDKLLGFIDRW